MAPVAWSFRPPASRAVVLIVVAITLVRYVPGWASLAASSTADSVRVMTWNLPSSPNSGARALEGILISEAEIIGVQELMPQAAQALDADETLLVRLPHRVLAPERTVLGMGLLSRYPIVEQQTWTEPPLLRAVVEHPTHGPFSVFVVHPLPAAIRTIVRVPVSFDSTRRDSDIAWIRSVIGTEASSGRPVLVIGDLNTTEREPAYAEFTAGMLDAHLLAGVGPGLRGGPRASDRCRSVCSASTTSLAWADSCPSRRSSIARCPATIAGWRPR